MKKHCALALFVALSIVIAAHAAASRQGDGKTSGTNGEISGAKIGTTIADFSLPDTDGKQHSLASLRGKNGTVLIFISVQCPVSNAYNERMEKLAQDYRSRGVNVIGINANATETAEAVKHHAAQHDLTFPVLKDKGNVIADTLGAQHTPEAFLLDANNRLVYRGRIDNAKNASMVSSSDLRDAIEETLAGKAVTKSEARAFGCTIKRVS